MNYISLALKKLRVIFIIIQSFQNYKGINQISTVKCPHLIYSAYVYYILLSKQIVSVCLEAIKRCRLKQLALGGNLYARIIEPHQY